MRSRKVGARTFYRLIAEHDGNAEAALSALIDIARAAGLPDYAPCPPEVAAAELRAGGQAGATPLFFDHPAYPALLAQSEDAPPLLWARGRLDLLTRPAIALVGARNASSLGLRMARSLAGGLGQAGHVTVSGLARGIDAETHRASLDTGTIAVVAGGVDAIYPRENTELTGQVAETGLILSEMPAGLRPQARHFPRRNRIIAGLAPALVVVEAAARSGSLITARDAADLGREVLAVPGHPFDARAAGCNQLLRDGATLVRGPADVLLALGDPLPLAQTAPSSHRPPPPVALARLPESAPADAPTDAPPASAILALLGPSPLAEEQVLRDTGLSPQTFAAAITELEMSGTVLRAPGGLLSRAG